MSEQMRARVALQNLIKDPRLHDPDHPDNAALVAQYRALMAAAYTGEETGTTFRFMGRDMNPLESSDAAQALGNAKRLMESRAYLDASDPLHVPTVMQVQRLFEAGEAGRDAHRTAPDSDYHSSSTS